ncbi:MAG: beta-lactamase family protein [Chloroflexota bacterium]|nr:MAG: beta-lactamase family protein [Chloroflexota bacterium]
MRVRLILKKFMTMLLALVILLSIIEPVMAEEYRAAPGGYVATSPSQGQGPTDPAELEAFLDELMAADMVENHIAGAAVSVVKDGKLFFAKGYGYADLEKGIPSDPEKTLFKIGSVTKLFTWTAVMQLVEQGKLDLEADINTYLDFRIPDTYPQPITLKHLMAHTAGFEDQHVDMVARMDEDLALEGEWLVSHIPARVRPPGEVPAYSNYGAALAGYIVAQVSGENYSQYVQNHILDPLAMEGSTAYRPTPPNLIARESVGYMDENGVIKVFPYITGQVDLYPTGVIRATVTDMARFMIAHLQDGFYGDAHTEVRILEETTARQMHSTLYAPDPRLLGNAYGFFEFSDNGQWVIGHSGEAEPMQSMLFLLPDQDLGVFVVYNSMGGGALTNQHLGFQRAFFDHYYPASAVEPIKPPADFTERADRFVGAYRWTQSSSTTLEKYSSQLFGYAITIENPGDGTLLLVAPWGEMPFVEEELFYFRLVDGPFHISFREDDQGRVAYLFTDFTPQFAFEKVEWYETVSFNIPLLLTSLLMFLSILPVALIREIRNRRKKDDQRSAPRGARVAYRLIVGISILNLLFVAGTIMWGEQIVFGIPLIYKFVMGLGVVAAVLTIGALVYTVLAWKDSYWSLTFRAYYTLVTVAAVAFVWFLNYWNLLGWRF